MYINKMYHSTEMTILLCTVEVFCYDNTSSHAFEYSSFFTFTTLSSRASNRVHVTIVNICKRHYSMSIHTVIIHTEYDMGQLHRE